MLCHLCPLRREGVAVHVGDGDDRTFFGEQVRNGLSDPMCASSDECRLALELIVHRFPGALIDAQNRSAAAIIASSPNPFGQRPAKGRPHPRTARLRNQVNDSGLSLV